MSARVTFTRVSPSDVGIRQVFVSIDGKSVAVLTHGQETTVEVPPGEHRIRIHNTLVWKTLRVTLADDEHARYDIINRAGFGTVALIATLGVGPIYLTVERKGLKA
jgi:hypothetical protein